MYIRSRDNLRRNDIVTDCASRRTQCSKATRRRIVTLNQSTSAIAFLIAFGAGTTPVSAANDLWVNQNSGGPSIAFWNDSSNWSLGFPPRPSDVAQFPAASMPLEISL